MQLRHEVKCEISQADAAALESRLGELSIVRFRTAIKEPLDIAFLLAFL